MLPSLSLPLVKLLRGKAKDREGKGECWRERGSEEGERERERERREREGERERREREGEREEREKPFTSSCTSSIITKYPKEMIHKTQPFLRISFAVHSTLTSAVP